MSTSAKVSGGVAVAKWRLSRVRMNTEYLDRTAVPAPFDIPILLSRLFPRLGAFFRRRWRHWFPCCFTEHGWRSRRGAKRAVGPA